jgi:phosphoglycolate phosphatase
MAPTLTSSRFRLLVFDWDGTLADSEDRIVSAALAAIAMVGLPERSRDSIKTIIGLGMSEAYETLFEGAARELEGRFIASYREHYLANTALPIPLFPGVTDTLRHLHGERYDLAVATGKGRRGLDRDMANNGLSEFFVTTKCADDAPSKPHPGMLLEIMAETNVDSAETLMIGDTAFDLEMARNAGVECVGVRTGVHDADRLLEFDPLVLLDSVAELPAWLCEN